MGKITTSTSLLALALCGCAEDELLPPLPAPEQSISLEVSRPERVAPFVATGAAESGMPAARNAAPLAETRSPRALQAGQPRRILRVSCSPESARLIGRRVEVDFETRVPGTDLDLSTARGRDSLDHLLMGSCDLVLCTTPLSPSEVRRGLRARAIAHRVVVPVVHQSNPVVDLRIQTLEQLRADKIQSWSALGWLAHQVLPAGRHLHDPQAFANRDLRMHGRAAQLQSDAEVLAFIANRPGAFGMVELHAAEGTPGVKLLRIHGVQASAQNLRNKSWPLGCTFWAVTTRRSSPPAEAFANYLLGGEAQQILQRVLIPVR